MPNEIYHRSEWGNPEADGFGDVYFDASATNKLYNHSDYYENYDGTDKILRDIPNKASIVLTPTAYSDGSLNTVIPPYQVLPQELVTNGTFDTDSDWNVGSSWTIANGVASSDGGNSFLTQNVGFVVGMTYQISFDISRNSGTLFIRNSSNVTLHTINESNDDMFQSFNYTATVTGLIRFYSYDYDGTIDNVSVKEIQEADFDFSRGSSATRVNEKGLIEDVASGIPRIDYTSGQGALLLETQSTNLVTYSEDFSQWGTVNGAVVTDNFTTSPDGTQNAAKVVYDGTSLGRIEISTGASGTNTQSIYLKTVSGTQAVSIGASSSDLTEVTVTSEWQRFTHTGSGSYPRVLCNNAATIYAWGAQLEQKSFATSYIPTEGSTVTRSADVANNSGNADLFNDSEGVLYAEIAKDTTSVDGGIAISDSSYTNRVLFYFDTSGNIRAYVYSSGEQAKIITSGLDYTDNNKLALKYSATSTKFFVNGFQVGSTDTGSTMPVGLSELAFDDGGAGSDFYGKTKELAVFKEALTDAELESLTSWISFVEMATDLEYTIE